MFFCQIHAKVVKQVIHGLTQPECAKQLRLDQTDMTEPVPPPTEPVSPPPPVDLINITETKQFRSIKCQAFVSPLVRTRRTQTKNLNLRHFGVQTLPLNDVKPAEVVKVSTSSQCCLIGEPLSTLLERDLLQEDGEDETDDQDDPDYRESESDDSTDNESDDEVASEPVGVSLQNCVNPARERQFLVSESCLFQLLGTCKTCQCENSVYLSRTVGTMAVITMSCPHGHSSKWKTQNLHSKMPWGNILLAGAILYSGSSPSKVITMMNHLCTPVISLRTFTRLQSVYLCPAVHTVWRKAQGELLDSVKTKLLSVGGDGRCDSPGHSAKYGAYTLMDLERNTILDVQLVQSNEVKGSNHMELEGLKRGLKVLQDNGCMVADLVTDRHVMVKKYMREQQSDINHYFDVWHMAKGVSKKLEAAAKKPQSSEIRPWIKSITNHMYWVATKDDGQLKKLAWQSIPNHIANIHEGHSELFPSCEHGEYSEDPIKWLKPGTRAFKLVKGIVESPYLLRDINKLSPLHQTYGLEVHHSIVNHFASKSHHYFYTAMQARTLIAVMHTNENGNKPQLTTTDGQERWQKCFPKSKKGQHAVVKAVKAKSTFEYVHDLVNATIERRKEFVSYKLASQNAKLLLPSVPQPLTSTYTSISKEELIKNKTSRYKRHSVAD